jgi:hypothetical protein
MDVWIVMECNGYDDPYINGVFGSEEGARRRLDEIMEERGRLHLKDDSGEVYVDLKDGGWASITPWGVDP